MNHHDLTAGISRARRTIALIALCGALLVAVACTDDDTANATDDRPGGAGGPSESQSFAIGELVELDIWQLRLHGVTDPYISSDELYQPGDGMRWIAVDTEVTNVGDYVAAVGSFSCFEVLDESDVGYGATMADAGVGPLDVGVVDVGESLRGTVYFEVPANATGLRFKFACPESDATAIVELG